MADAVTALACFYTPTVPGSRPEEQRVTWNEGMFEK